MTEEELSKVPFHFVASLSLENEHTLSYASEDNRLGICDHTPKRKDGTFGRTYRHYRIDKKVFKKKEKFLEALKDFSPKVVLIKKEL